MGFFSSQGKKAGNSLNDALEEGLRNPYRFSSDRECIDSAVNCLNAFATPGNAYRDFMIAEAASNVAGIKDSRTRECFMGILDRCSQLSSHETIKLSEREKAILRDII